MSLSRKVQAIKRAFGRKLAGSNPHDLAWFFCQGDGLEVGARSNPYPFMKAKVKYADIGDDLVIRSIARTADPNVKIEKYATVDYILHGPEYGLVEIQEGSLDFVFSDNVLEHTSNPLFALNDQLRVLRRGGILYCIVPNKNYTFDSNRSATRIEKLIYRYQNRIFEHSIEDALDIIRYSIGHPAKNAPYSEQLICANKMISSGDGAEHFFVFDECNTLEMLYYLTKHFECIVTHFSALPYKGIHFAVKKV